MSKKHKKVFVTYCFLGKRDHTTTILGYSRDRQALHEKLLKEGWHDNELVVEELVDEMKVQ